MRRRVVCVVLDGFQQLDLAGPADVFAAVDVVLPGAGYDVEVVSTSVGPVRAGNGTSTLADAALVDVSGQVDTLVVVGGPSATTHADDPRTVAGILGLAALSRRVASVCSGAFLLAAAGLLDGRHVTTHWMLAHELAARHPSLRVDVDRLFVRDGEVWTAAGVSAGIDLALALVAEDHGHAVAREVARGLVVYLRRPGGQRQFSTPVRPVAAHSGPLAELRAFIEGHPTDDLSLPALARRVGMSPRHLSRVFGRDTGQTPGRYVEISRIDAARRLLETTDHPLDRVARDVGLGSPDTLHRVFRRHWRITPGEHRRRFRSTGA